MKRHLPFAFTILFAVFLCAGCSPWEGYKETVRDGIKTIPHVQEIKNIFSNAPMDNFFIQYALNRDKPTTWNTVVYFGGRYEFTYVVDVMIDYKQHKVIKVMSQPKFYLLEIDKLSDGSGKQLMASSETVGATYVHPGYPVFGKKEWNKIVAAHGDFSAIGIHLNTNSPISGFDQYVRGWREGRIQVEP